VRYNVTPTEIFNYISNFSGKCYNQSILLPKKITTPKVLSIITPPFDYYDTTVPFFRIAIQDADKIIYLKYFFLIEKTESGWDIVGIRIWVIFVVLILIILIFVKRKRIVLLFKHSETKSRLSSQK